MFVWISHFGVFFSLHSILIHSIRSGAQSITLNGVFDDVTQIHVTLCG